jgi:hypothetical protein
MLRKKPNLRMIMPSAKKIYSERRKIFQTLTNKVNDYTVLSEYNTKLSDGSASLSLEFINKKI